MSRSDYRVFVHSESLEVLPKSGRRRESVVRFFDDLQMNPHLGGDTEAIDPETGGTVSVVAGFSITWWVDEPVKEVKISDIRKLG